MKSRPYLTCGSCSVRIFPRGVSSLVGLAMVSPLTDALRERIKSDRDEWNRAQETRHRVEAAMTHRTAPVEAATAATLADAPTAAAGGAR